MCVSAKFQKIKTVSRLISCV